MVNTGEGGTLAHDGACITEFSTSMKTTFKYAGIATGCAGCVCERNLKKVFDDRCILWKVTSVSLYEVDAPEVTKLRDLLKRSGVATVLVNWLVSR